MCFAIVIVPRNTSHMNSYICISLVRFSFHPSYSSLTGIVSFQRFCLFKNRSTVFVDSPRKSLFFYLGALLICILFTLISIVVTCLCGTVFCGFTHDIGAAIQAAVLLAFVICICRLDLFAILVANE